MLSKFWNPNLRTSREERMSSRAVKPVRRKLGARLRAFRKERGLSQEKLGEKSGLSGKFIGEVEREEKSISLDSLAHVAAALDVPLRDLTDGIEENKRITPEMHRETERIRALLSVRKPPAVIRQARRVLEACFRQT